MPDSTELDHSSVVTMINVFTVEPEHQQRFIELLQHVTDDVMGHLTGFVCASVLLSMDGRKVVNYSQWDSQQSLASMLLDPEADACIRELRALGTPAPVLCKLVSVRAGAGSLGCRRRGPPAGANP